MIRNPRYIELREKYRKHILNNYKTPEEIVNLLNIEFNIFEETEENYSNPNFVKRSIENFQYAYLSKNLPSSESMNYKVFRLICDSNSEYFYNYNKKYYKTDNHIIYFFIELKTGYIQTNCNLLMNYLVIQRGLSQEEIVTESILIYHYLEALEHYYSNTENL